MELNSHRFLDKYVYFFMSCKYYIWQIYFKLVKIWVKLGDFGKNTKIYFRINLVVLP